MPETSPSVLIIRLDAIGDALALTPLLAALHDTGIPVDLVLRENNAQIFAARAARRVIVAGFALRSNERSTRAAIEALGAQLAAEHYTHVLVATEDASGYRLARATGAPHRIGFANTWGKPLKRLWTRAFLTQRVDRTAGLDRRAPHEVEVLFRLGAGLVSDLAPTRDVSRLRPLVLESEPEPDGRIVVQVTDKWVRLGFAFDDVATTVRDLAHTASSDGIRLIASASESAFADAVANETGMHVERFDRLGAWKSAIAAARLLVAPDSGALHVAGMIGTPIIAVFPAKDFALQTARWSPWAAPSQLIEGSDGWTERVVAAIF